MGEKQDKELNESNVKDKYHLIRLLFYCMGVSWQIPSNFLVTANQYWMYKFRDPNLNSTNSNHKTTLQTQFTSTFNATSQTCIFVFVIVGVILAKRLGFKVRVLGCLSINVLMFVMTMAFIGIDTDSWQLGFFIMTMASVAVLSATTAVFLITLFVMAAKFPSVYVAYATSGQSICGIFAALTQIFALSLGTSPEVTAIIYFSVGTVFLIGTLILYFIVSMNSEFYVYHVELKEHVEQKKMSAAAIKHSLFKLRFYVLSLAFSTCCNIMMHSSVTSLIVSSNYGNGDPWSDKFFIPVATFLNFNLIEFVGREAAGFIKKPSNIIMIFIATVIRLSFIPLFMFCNLQPRKHLPVVFKNDAFYIAIMMAFAFTGGYFVNVAVLHKDKVMSKDEEAVDATLIMVILLISVTATSFLSVAIIEAL